MPIFSRNEKRILFIHIPKAAGTTIEEAFVSAGYDMSYRRGGRYGPFNDFDKQNRCSPQHMHAKLLEKHFANEEFDVCFTIVRHPVMRIVSEYKFRIDSDHSFSRGKSLDDFVNAALDDYESNPMLLDNHIRPQEHFLWRACEVIRLEDGLARVSEMFDGEVRIQGPARMASKDHGRLEMSEATLARVQRFYQSDFARFGYE